MCQLLSGYSSTFTYDNFNNVLSISDGTDTLTNSYNAMGQHLSQTQKHGTVSYQYDAAGRRSRMTWPDGFYVTYDWNDVSQLTHIRENGASTGLGVLATFEYDEMGRRTRLLRGNGTETRYDFDAMGRLDELVTDLAGTADDNTDSFTFNPAGQIASRSRTNTDYSYASHINVDTLFTHNGLNQIDTISTATNPTYDGRGNLTSDGTRSYTYDTYNRMTSATVSSGTVNLDYDPLGRLEEVVTTAGTAVGFLWDGWDQIGYQIGGSLSWRFVHGPGTNEALLHYRSGTRTWLHADAQGSIIAHTNDAGTVTQTNRYDGEGGPREARGGPPERQSGPDQLGPDPVYRSSVAERDRGLLRQKPHVRPAPDALPDHRPDRRVGGHEYLRLCGRGPGELCGSVGVGKKLRYLLSLRRQLLARS
jgi:YD repeat-containing protein